MSNFLMYLISYIFVIGVLLGASICFGACFWAVSEFLRGFFSVFLGWDTADRIANQIPFVLAGMAFTAFLIALTWV